MAIHIEITPKKAFKNTLKAFFLRKNEKKSQKIFVIKKKSLTLQHQTKNNTTGVYLKQQKTTKKMALVKGTTDYKKAQQLAVMIEESAFESRYNRLGGMYAEWAVSDVLKMTGNFAVEIAKTIKEKYEKYHCYYISNKQAWILACTLIEAGIDY